MKITSNQGLVIKIPAGKESFSLIKNINQGDILSATIIRAEGNRAILETAGKHITVEFTGGIPGTKIINLILMEKSPDKIVFALAGDEKPDKIFSLLSSFSLISEEEFKKNTLQTFARYINTARPDLMDINLFFLGLKNEKERGRKNSVLFRNLQQKGIPYQTLIDLAYIIYSRYNPLLFQAYRYLLNFTEKKSSLNHGSGHDSLEEAIDSICDFLKEDDADFSIMLDLIFDDNTNNMSYGFMAFPDGKSFSDAEFILHDDSVFLKLDLSSTGIIEVFVRLLNDSVLINFLSEKEDVVQFLEQNEGILKKMLEQNNVKKSSIAYYNSKK